MRQPWLRRIVPAVLVVGLCASTAAAADFKFGARLGYYTDAGEPFLGVEGLFRMAHRIYFNPNLEWVLVDNVKYFTLNADAHYDFPTHGHYYLWAGGGLAIISVDPDGPVEGNTDLGVNFLAGIGLKRKGLIPYFQAKLIAKDGTEFVIAFGVRF